MIGVRQDYYLRRFQLLECFDLFPSTSLAKCDEFGFVAWRKLRGQIRRVMRVRKDCKNRYSKTGVFPFAIQDCLTYRICSRLGEVIRHQFIMLLVDFETLLQQG